MLNALVWMVRIDGGEREAEEISVKMYVVPPISLNPALEYTGAG